MLLIRNGYLLDPSAKEEGTADILIDNSGLIAGIRRHASAKDAPLPEVPASCTADAAGCIVIPGLVDTHSHFRDPGQTEKEDIASGAAAAAAGGYTHVVMMANTRPCIDSTPVLQDVLARGRKTAIDVQSCACLTKDMAGRELTDMEQLAAAGASGFTDDGRPVIDAELLTRGLEKAAALRLPVSLHEEDPAFLHGSGVNAGSRAAKALSAGGADREAEISLVRRDLAIALRTGADLCIQHVSAAESVALIREARKRSPHIHAEATPHHFTLTEDAVLTKGTLAKVNPPLRTERDREAILEGLADGTLDIIATDHAPHTKQQKALPFPEAPSGMIGLETAFSLGLRELVNKNILSLRQLVTLMTVNPAALYRLQVGKLQTGMPADLAVIDTGAHRTVSADFVSRSSNSPFIGESLPGVVRLTVFRGKIAYRA